MKTKTWKVMTTTGKQADLESGLEKKEIKSRRTSAPETLSIGWRLKATLTTILLRSLFKL